MVKLKNTRKVRLIDGKGRFDLKPGDTVSFTEVPKDLKNLVSKGFLKEIKPKPKPEKEKRQVEPQNSKVGGDTLNKAKGK